MPPDIAPGWAEANSKTDALITSNERVQDTKTLKKNKGNSIEKALSDSATQLDKIKEQQKLTYL